MGNPNDDVDGKDLIRRGFDYFFTRLGDTIHGATTKNTTQEDSKKTIPATTSPNGKKGSTAPSEEIETSGEEVQGPDLGANRKA